MNGRAEEGQPSKQPKWLNVELLEGRDLPATLTLNGSVLTYDAGTGVNNSLSVTVSFTVTP